VKQRTAHHSNRIATINLEYQPSAISIALPRDIFGYYIGCLLLSRA
jgi:hypothetical protein